MEKQLIEAQQFMVRFHSEGQRLTSQPLYDWVCRTGVVVTQELPNLLTRVRFLCSVLMTCRLMESQHPVKVLDIGSNPIVSANLPVWWNGIHTWLRTRRAYAHESSNLSTGTG